MNTAAETIKHWNHVFPYAHIPENQAEYEKLLSFIDDLMKLSRHKKDERITALLHIIAKNIEQYETRRYPKKSVTPIEMLEFLMQEHHLSQNDLPEIGSQSLVSKILHGERNLTTDHIKKLSERFGVSPEVFL